MHLRMHLADAPRALVFHVERVPTSVPAAPSQRPHVGAEARARRSAAGWSSRIWKPSRCGLARGLAPDRPRDRLLEPGRHGALIGIRRRTRSGRLRRPGDLALERPNRPAAFGRPAREQAPAVMVGLGQQRLAVALGERAGVDQLDRPRRAGRAAASCSRCRLGCGRSAWRARALVIRRSSSRTRERPGLLDRAQVLADDVLDQRELERSGLVERVVDECRDRRLAGELGGAPAPLAGDELVPVARPAGR